MKRNNRTSQKTNTGTQRGGQNSETNEMSEGDHPLHELFLDELSDLLNAEKQLTKALPKMAKAAQSEELREAFESHLEETEGHIERLEQVAQSIDETLKPKKCKAMEGLIEEGSELMSEYKGDPALDAALIAAAQKVEHYEIASYGTVIAWAERMGHDEAVELLKETLNEEENAGEKLTEVAETLANSEAAHVE